MNMEKGPEPRGTVNIPCRLDLLTERLFPEGIIGGQQILFSGEPGVSKSTFLLQAMSGFAEEGIGSLYITSEQARGQIQDRLSAVATRAALPFIQVKEAKSVDELGEILSHTVDVGPYRVLVVDSLQGLGLSPSQHREWEKLFGLMKFLRLQRLAAFFIGQVTKNREIAGPKKLEHEVDTVFGIRRAFAYRLMSVSKNRFGPSSAEPVVCTVDAIGRLFPAQRDPAAIVATAAGFDERGLVEVEAKVEFNLQARSRRPALNGISKDGFQKLLSVLRGMGVDIGGFGSQTACNMPGGGKYRPEHDLPIAMALLGSYLQLPITESPIFLGELGLNGELRWVPPSILQRLAATIDQDSMLVRHRTIVMERDSAMIFKGLLDSVSRANDVVLIRATTLSGVASRFLLHEPPPEVPKLDDA